MINKVTIKSEIDLVQTLKSFAQAYEEISVVRMQRVRSSVLATREFIDMLSEIFGEVKANYRDQINHLLESQRHALHLPFIPQPKHMSLADILQKNKKTVSVFLSANTKLHGDIIKRSFRFFLDSIANTETDIVIVGRIGKDLFEQYAKGRPFQYFDLPETKVTIQDLKPLMAFILPYAQANVYYGQFNNVIKQSPTVTNVSGEVEEQAVEAKSSGTNTLEAVKKEITETHKHYLFEPSVEKIIAFFSTEAFSSFVMQAVHESELARLASRINAMEDALSNIDKRQGKLTIEQRRLRHRTAAKKQLDALGSISLWLK